MARKPLLFRLIGRASKIVAAGAFLLAVSSSPRALVQVTLDAETLTDFLQTVTPKSIQYNLPAVGDVAIQLSDVRVTGFEPAAGEGRGHVLTALTLAVPALGLKVPVTPRLSVSLETSQDGQRLAALRFEQLMLPLLGAAAVDIGSLMPVYRVPAEAAWTVALREGDVEVKSKLVETRLGTEGIRLGFDVDMGPPATGK
jgi:hypothetical protein